LCFAFSSALIETRCFLLAEEVEEEVEEEEEEEADEGVVDENEDEDDDRGAVEARFARVVERAS